VVKGIEVKLRRRQPAMIGTPTLVRQIAIDPADTPTSLSDGTPSLWITLSVSE
jgi:hypothetical protein